MTTAQDRGGRARPFPTLRRRHPPLSSAVVIRRQPKLSVAQSRRALVTRTDEGPHRIVVALVVLPAATQIALHLIERTPLVIRIATGDVAYTITKARVIELHVAAGLTSVVLAIIVLVLAEVLHR